MIALAYCVGMARPADTSADAYRRQIIALRSMSPADRLRLADVMSTEVRSLAESGIRNRHPDWTPEELAGELARILIGSEAARATRRGRPGIDR